MIVYLRDPDVTLYHGDVLDTLRAMPDESVDCVVTSPPYLDARPEYPSPTLHGFEDILRELSRVVTGPMLWNLGRIFRNGCEVRWQEDILRAADRAGWSHVDTRVWIKPNANPIHGAIFADRHEYVYVLGEPGQRVNVDAARVPYAPASVPRMRRGWTNHVGVKGDDSRRRGRRGSEPHPLGARPPSYIVAHTGRHKGNAHPAPMPLDLAESLVEIASWPGETVLDPFVGSGTTCLAARKHNRRSIGIDLNADYLALAARRLQQLSLFALEETV